MDTETVTLFIRYAEGIDMELDQRIDEAVGVECMDSGCMLVEGGGRDRSYDFGSEELAAQAATRVAQLGDQRICGIAYTVERSVTVLDSQEEIVPQGEGPHHFRYETDNTLSLLRDAMTEELKKAIETHTGSWNCKLPGGREIEYEWSGGETEIELDGKTYVAKVVVEVTPED